MIPFCMTKKKTPETEREVAAPSAKRVFKTKWFTREAKARKIADSELCDAINELLQGQGDDLGGGVWKKRLNKNLDRSIVLAKGGSRWIYAYLFEKKDRANIEEDELKAFKKLAKDYEKASDEQIKDLLKSKELTEICHDCEDKI